ncbi:Type II pantothenate kinase [Dillenia turbinata]|uniref:pantothenate kinase n=1 Tax=Dillenia turbinata TaxID=194707 RepID=A0AAN8VPJ3_9MAGN
METCSFGDEIEERESKISHLAIDIGGSLIKLVYFSRDDKCSTGDQWINSSNEGGDVSSSESTCPILEGKLHFAKFETSKINECVEFIRSKKLHHSGGGAYKYTDLFKEELGVALDKEDEMNCLVAGANFLLKTVRHEAFTYLDNKKEFEPIDQNDLYPYLLVNIGSGVSMIKVDGDGKFERVSGTNVGGGTYWGLGKLLTKCKSFDELLELSHHGNNRVIDMLVGDIYGGLDYTKIGLSATAIASSFGKAINKDLEEYRPEDISRSLLRLISNNIGQISFLNALRYGIKRIFFGGFFIRGHPYTMDTIAVGVHFWSKGEAKAMFLRHEGFLGALGAFVSYGKSRSDDIIVHCLVERSLVCTPCRGAAVDTVDGNMDESETIECCVYPS